MPKEKTNQDGGGDSSSAAAKQLARLGGAKKGAAKYADKDGPGDFPDTGVKEHQASVSHDKAGNHLGAKRMGYSQMPGAARMNGYAKGANKVMDIMTFGAANAGHGVTGEHNHPTKTITSQTNTGGPTVSSNTNTVSSEKKDVSYASAYKNADQSKYPTLSSFTKAAKSYNSSNPKPASSNTSTVSSSPVSNSTSSVTTTSPNSLEQTAIKNSMFNENLLQKNAYDKEEANIKVGIDSSSAAQKYILNKPPHLQNNPKVISNAGKIGAHVAKKGRIKSGHFSIQEALKIQRAGLNQ